MKKRILYIGVGLLSAMLILCACGMQATGSVKNLTRPYIAQYDCVYARLGDEDFLEKFDFIRITLLDSKKLEISFKEKDGEKQSYECAYQMDNETRVITADVGILGFPYKESAKIENGEFTINKNFLGRNLVLKFEMK